MLNISCPCNVHLSLRYWNTHIQPVLYVHLRIYIFDISIYMFLVTFN